MVPFVGLPPPLAALVVGLASAAIGLLVGTLRSDAASATAVPLLVNVSEVNVKQLRMAASSLGVFRLAADSVDVEAALEASRSFFALPEAVKRSAKSATGVGGFKRGYIPLAGESGLRDYVELKEGFCYGAEPDGSESTATSPNATTESNGLKLLLSPNAWPDEHERALGPAWVPTMLRHLQACEALSNQLLRALSVAMGHEAGFLGALATGGEPISLMRLFHYFPNTTAPHVAPAVPRIGSSPHSDWHLLTIVVQDTTGGLQARRPDAAEWIDVPAEPGEIVIILGDYLSAISNGSFVSPVHRVLLPPPPTERFSFTYFRYPQYGALVPAESARRAQQRALRNARRRRRKLGSRAAEAFNTLIRATEGVGLEQLATTPFGDLLLHKWLGVAANKV